MIGAFVSMPNASLYNAITTARSIGAECFMVFTRSPRAPYNRTPICFREATKDFIYADSIGLGNFTIHAPYVLNLASPDIRIRSSSIDLLVEEMDRAFTLGADSICLHPGYYKGHIDQRIAERELARSLDEVYLRSENHISICLETMTGKGTELGGDFKSLVNIIEHSVYKDLLKICVDTCHIHDAGYSLSSDPTLILDTLISTFGIDKLSVFHLNGSKNPAGSRKDRHANLLAPDNHIPLEVFKEIVTRDEFKDKIKVLETPNTDLYKQEIRLLKDMRYQ